MMPIPILTGPTASGKSALALKLAQGNYFEKPIEIIAADAMQVYCDMDIGTAKPTPAERAQVSHHLIDVVPPSTAFSVAEYLPLAEKAIADVLGRDHIPLVVGGTGFYIRALSEGLATVPPADAEVQVPLWERIEREGVLALQKELEAMSPVDAVRAGNNPRRVVRALEIIMRTGMPPTHFPYTVPRFKYVKLVLDPEKASLKPRIEARTQAMFDQGLVEEVTALIETYPNLPTALQAIGYKEVQQYLQGELTLSEAQAQVTLATEQYAKRQRTWFRKEPQAELLPLENYTAHVWQQTLRHVELRLRQISTMVAV